MGAEKASQWFIERYTLARRIYHIRDQRAHDGFADKRTGAQVPAQTWAQWFEWAYGMTLDEYATIARDGKHGAQIAVEDVAMCEYRDVGAEHWSLVRGVPGETYEQLAVWMKARFPGIETRPRKVQ